MNHETPTSVDLHHLGRIGSMSAHLFAGVVVDPGCELTIDRVIAALGDDEPDAILLTHIHFDHAGGTGRLLERYPDAEVWVHERGAPHMIAPRRLVTSARRVFGEAFDALWGEVLPVPEASIRVLKGGESIGPWEVRYTPGHAQHHVSFLHSPTRTAFTGDVTGVRIGGGPAYPPTPPPDIDPPLWHRSLELVADWEPERLAFMHFGQATDPEHQIAMMHENLDRFEAAAGRTDADGMAAWIREWLSPQVSEERLGQYYLAGPFEGMWSGFERYRQASGA